ncbi:helix-turn-helix transcriptional regulator [Alkalicoccobacillus murimartini]|uniref:Excisionase family DNA binding protein n=1 Tax=Alkalicoccobacillus murimartini TaxID=171685 RepID=A0ABT9YMR0_9BACI|nr:helix-turn-helix domain-containing protein [Alkalicoccobacillus murimartini]MDQ0208929.1 excisionase family DNA binding protein [Alkalicoccobacillus murimartini]
MPEKLEKELLTVTDIKKITGLGRDTVYELMHSGEFTVLRFGRSFKANKREFYDWLNNKNNSNSYVYTLKT